ncbi:hypothetical protein HGRIS_012694 [Hohenbuehelia grisea]|uniref:Transmembrane protein n=1 Tax=Hohenbuehelia grisea TaxID=104357 RepID=A0ABR3IT57_9AGAR
MDQEPQEEPGPSNGHLGTAWEIAVVVVFVCVICAVILTMVFHLRRRSRRRRQAVLDAESQQEKDPAENNERRTSRFANDDGMSLARPEPVAQSHRSSRASSHSNSDPRAHRPPRYYWDTARR